MKQSPSNPSGDRHVQPNQKSRDGNVGDGDDVSTDAKRNCSSSSWRRLWVPEWVSFASPPEGHTNFYNPSRHPTPWFVL
jgi:hypothetical protein